MAVTFNDISLREYNEDNLKILGELRKELLKAPVEICIERAVHITEYMKKNPQEEKFPLLFRAKAVANYLKNKKAVFPDKSLLAGTTGSKLKSALLFPEFIGLTIWSELDTISKRGKNPQLLSKEDARKLNLEVYPYWLERDVLSSTKKEFGEGTPIRLLEKLIFYLTGKGACISHTVPMFERVLSEGLDSIIAEANEKASTKNESEEFYNAVSVVLEGFLSYTNRLSEAAYKRAESETGIETKKRFKRMAEACKNVPAKPASSFYEAVTCVWLCLIAIHAENMNIAISPGRLDQILYPYYKADIDSGVIAVEEAFEIVGSLWVKLGDNVNLVPQVSEELFGGAGTAPAVTIGGVDKDGEDAVNDLTYIMLRVTELLKLREPNMNARFHPEKNEKRYRDRVAEVIASTKAVPAFYNDTAIVKTLENQGISEKHARDYAVIGCVEFAVGGRSYDASSDLLLNLAAPLEMALYNGKRYRTGDEDFGAPKTGEAGDFKSYEQFWVAFKTQLLWVIKQGVTLSEQMAVIHQKRVPTPLLSALFDGPMEKGKDLVFGGATYNSSGATHIGFADVVDSLNAIKAVFDDKHCNMRELISAVRADFKDNEKLRKYLTEKPLKYGTKVETDNGVSCELVKLLYDTYQGYTNDRGGVYRSSFWSMTNHAGHGKITHALPNGRKAGLPFASGITPVSNAARSLPECLNAVAALGYEYMPGGIALNIKFTMFKNKDESKKLGDFVEAYFINGGLQVQFNIMSRQMLEEARKNPSKYPDLLVRVSGYSAYFNDLSDSMKQELIDRTEYGINDGKAVL
jgi:formate C-acetyltransferase